MRISIELVPRGGSELQEQLDLVRARFSRVDTVNVPDILRFEMRSWHGCAQARPHFRAIPHLRAIDIDPDRPLAIAPFLREHGIDEVLVVAGDAPADMAHPVYSASSVQVIRKLRRELPEVRVYAALDPYRQSVRRELEYAQQKLEAGAVGLFTQPFFDLRLLAVYAELLAGVDVFWGVTTVTNERSRRYWQTRNQAFFPADFEPTLAWNRTLARGALEFAEARDASIYFMPIRTGLQAYLDGIL